MTHWTSKLIMAAVGCIVFAQPISAQPKAPEPKVNDHRTPKADPKVNDHRTPKADPKVHDHRTPKADPKVNDHRTPKADPKVHDHRTPKADPKVHDHRTPKADPKVHDHRTPKADPQVGRKGRDRRGSKVDDHRGPKVNDHRLHTPDTVADPGSVPPAAGRRPHSADGRRRARYKRWSAYETPVVNRSWPAKGVAGTVVTIDGANFSPAYAVFVGDLRVDGAKVTPTQVTFTLPAGATNGIITIRGDSRSYPAGLFEVVDFDAKAERKKRRAEYRKSAEAAWKLRKKDIAADREARLLALQEREAALAESRSQRRSARHVEIRAQFEAAFLADDNTMAEFSLHAERLARLERMQRLAEANANAELGVRINVALAEENNRHTIRLATLKAAVQF